MPLSTAPSQLQLLIVTNATWHRYLVQAIAHATSDSIQKYLLDYPDSILAAVHFVFNGDPTVGSSLAGFKLQTNTTSKFFKDTYQDPNLFVQLPTQSAVQREISRYFMAPAFQGGRCGAMICEAVGDPRAEAMRGSGELLGSGIAGWTRHRKAGYECPTTVQRGSGWMMSWITASTCLRSRPVMQAGI